MLTLDWIELAQDRGQYITFNYHGNESLGSINRWEILEWLRNWRLFKKSSAP
jgi:hypothetical protein